LVVPISLYEITSQLHHVLRHYKSDRYPHLHDQFGAQVASLLSYFLISNGDCIAEAAGEEWGSSGIDVGDHTGLNRSFSLQGNGCGRSLTVC